MYSHLLLLAALVTLVTAFPLNDGASEHIQHVTIPPSSPTIASNSHIQRVPSTQTSEPEPTTKTKPIQQAMESSNQASTVHMEETTIPQTTSDDEITTEVSVDVEEDFVVVPEPRDDLKMPVDDLVTANFLWGLGPIYPHLYQFKRVPHLVPIHSWNPYHDYYTYHQKYPRRYSF